MNIMKNMPKKRRRSSTPKIRVNHNASASSTKASSSSPPEDEPVVSKPRIQPALAVSDEEATLSSQSSVPVQNVDGHCLETLSLMLVKQILFPSQANSEDTHADLECVTDNNPYEMEVNAVSNVSPSLCVPTSENPSGENTCSESDISEPQDPITEVGGYEVKKESAPLLKAIFKKHGDIAKNSAFSMESRLFLLDLACTIYKRLEASNIMNLTQLELDSIRGQIKDLELVKVDVGWLQNRVDMIAKFMDMGFDGMEAVEAAINEKKRSLKEGEEKLQELKVRLQQEKDELEALEICQDSLVDGLL